MLIDDLALKNTGDLAVIGPDDKISKATNVLNGLNIGALPVCNSSGEIVGILSERDIVRGMSDNGSELQDLDVSDLMTTEVVTCGPTDDVGDVMAIMDDRRIRHIPVVKDDNLVSIVSSRDVMSAVLDETKTHFKNMGLAYEMVR